VYPTEAEVSRLMKENNLLHEQLIQEKQLASSSESKLMLAVKREQDLKSDFSFMLASKESRVQALVDENYSIKAKLHDIAEKSLEVKENSKSGKLGAELRKKIAEILELTGEIKASAGAYVKMANCLKKADEELARTKGLVSDYESEKITLKTSLQAKTQESMLKDKEIKRLQNKVMEEGITHLQEFWNKNYSE